MAATATVMAKACDGMRVLLFLGLWLSLTATATTASSTTNLQDPSFVQVRNDESKGGGEEEEEDDDEEMEPVFAVLMPWFAQALGVVVFYLLTRHIHHFPYTAILFIVGVFMGVGAARSNFTDQLTESILLWTRIDKEVLFCTFLPGLLFKDAFEINFYLFQTAFWQLILLAFPMVLAGTLLTALIGLYILPYDWSWHLSLTFGSILAATDPVAVSALMNEVGAPPRLRLHISGESLLNDGSAVVFYTVFAGLFLFDLGIPGLGEASTTGEAFVTFFRMSLGGVAVGIAYAIALVAVLYRLDRKYEGEETVVQVATTMAAAYLSFYTSEIVCHMSGVIAVVTCGILTKAFGAGLISDWPTMTSFWSIVEHLLNTVIFTLGGIVFGDIIASADGRAWDAKDWGYLLLLYFLVQIIRFFLIAAFYPVVAKIGLGSSPNEAIFSSFAGLRGAVGIALALGLDSQVQAATHDPELIIYTTKVFGMVGGVAFLTLVINGPLCGPLLSYLDLADSTETRKRIVHNVEDAMKRRMLDDFIHLMTDPRYYFVDFALVMHHCPLLRDLTAIELQEAVQQNKDTTHPSQYKYPSLDHVLPYIPNSAIVRNKIEASRKSIFMDSNTVIPPADELDELDVVPEMDETGHNEKPNECDPALVRDMRLMFVELLRASYQAQIRDGELDPREYNGFLRYILLQSLEFAHESASRDKPLDDWNAAQIVSPDLVDKTTDWGRRAYACCYHNLARSSMAYENNQNDSITHQQKDGTTTLTEPEASVQSRSILNVTDLKEHDTLDRKQLRLEILMAFSFLDAHREAEDRLNDEFGQHSKAEIKAAFELVTEESKVQSSKAKAVLRAKNRKQLRHVISHYLCIILLNKAARYVQVLLESGVILQREARHFLEEIEDHLKEIRMCSMDKHPNSLEFADQDDLVGSLTGQRKRRKREKQNSLL